MTVRWCFAHNDIEAISLKGEPMGICLHAVPAPCDVADMVPVRAGTELFQRPPQGDCTICGERNLTNNCFESLDGDAWCYKEGCVRAGTELYEATGVPAARPAELQDLIEDGWLVRVGEGTE